MSSRSKQLKIGAILSYTGIFISIITGITYHPWMIKTIGKADYGLYTLAMSLINTFMIDFGLSMAAQRFVSKYLAEKDQKAIDNVVGLIFKLYFFIAALLLLIFTVMYFFIDGIYVQLTVAEISKFKVLYIMAAIYSVTTFPFITLNGILKSYEKFISFKVCDLIHQITTVTLTALALIMGHGVYILVVVNLISSAIYTIIRIVSIKKHIPLKPDFKYYDKNMVKVLFRFSIWTAISTIVVKLMLTLAPSILGIFASTAAIAVFGYAVSIEGHVYSFINAINGFFMPRLSVFSVEKDEEKGREKVLQLMITVGRFIFMLFGLIFIGFMVLGKDFITMLVGPEYLNSYYCMLLICAYGVIAYPQQIANTYTIVKNKVKIRAYVSILAMVVYIVCALVFSKYWGAIGASLAVCVALFFQTALMNVVYYKVLKIDIFTFFKKCHLKLLPSLVVFGVIAFMISKLSVKGWIGFGIKGMLIVGVFGILAWFVMLTKQEKKFLLKK